MKKERFNYGASTSAERYRRSIERHPDIPQADAAILDEIELLQAEKGREIAVLDLGCGPDRLTSKIGKLNGVRVTGLDISPEFIEAAERMPTLDTVRYVPEDFLRFKPRTKYDAIAMQGVFHHVHGDERAEWLAKIRSMLAPGGRLIIGDEFLPAYANEEERRARAALFYLGRVIGEALQGGFDELAQEEYLNVIADVLSGEECCGYYDDEMFDYLHAQAVRLHKKLYSLGPDRIRDEEVVPMMAEVIGEIRKRARLIKESGASKKIDRGDLKVSIGVLRNELKDLFTLIHVRTMGPVYDIGGMGVLTFEKG